MDSRLLESRKFFPTRADEAPEIQEQAKMFVLVREDLPPGLRAAQAGHAVAELAMVYPERAWKWKQDGNYLIVLGVENEQELIDWFHVSKDWDLPRVVFHEPDLSYSATALACLPNPEENWLFSTLPLAYSKKIGFLRRLLKAS